jgi:hypothetical protein
MMTALLVRLFWNLVLSWEQEAHPKAEAHAVLGEGREM